MPYAFGAAAGGKTYPQYFITKSQTWVPPEDGNICIHVIGGGGSGAVGTTSWGAGAAAAYGKIASLAVTTSGSFTLVVGAGGAMRMGIGEGYAGGNSTIAGTGITGTLTCGGGGGGRTDMYNAETTYNAAGGAVSGSANEGWAGFSGGTGTVSGGAVGVYATGATMSAVSYLGAKTDAGPGGILASRYGTICGGQRGGVWQSNQSAEDQSDHIHGEDFCGGGYAYSSVGINSFSGNGGIAAGGGACRSNNSSYAGYMRAGTGGHGIILIQYLPG